MTDANDMYDINMRELNDVVLPDADETTEQHKSFSFHEGEDLDDIPPSLLSYFETSKSRAAVCEKLILEKHEDFTASRHAEDMMTLPIELDEDMMKLSEQVICDRENEENNTSSDTRLLPAPTETESLFTHNVSVYPNNEDEAGTDDYDSLSMSEKHLAFLDGTIEVSLNEEEINKSSEYKAERDKVRCGEMKKEEQKRHRERKFQEELKKIMEAEKVHEKELELMEKTAQEKLEQEFLLQQELIRNLQRRVEEERRKREEEQKRMKDEEDKQKREEEKNKIEDERKRMEEETRRRKREEEKKMEEVRRKKEEERKNVEEKKRIMEREEKRKREEERNKIDLEKKKLEAEMRMMKEEEKRKKKEEVERTKKKEEEERKKIEEMRKEVENERKRKMEKQMSLKEEEWRKKEEERKNREQKNMRREEEIRITKATEEKKKQEEMKRKKEEEEEEEADESKNMAQEKMYEEMRTRNKEQHGYADREIKLEDRKKKEESDRKKREEDDDEKKETRKREKESKKMEEKKEVREVVRKQEGEDSNMEEELRPTEEDEKRKKEEEQRRRQKDKMMRQRDEERKSEEMRLDKEGNKGHDVDYKKDRKMEQENKTKIKEKKQEEEEKRKRVERKNAETEEEQNGEEVRETKKTEEEIQLKETGERKKRTPAQEKEVRINEVREKKENESMVGQNEKNNFNKTENSSQLKDCSTRTSSSPDPLHSASTTCYTSTEARPQQHDLHKNVSQTSPDKNQEVTSSTASVLLPVCLPEHTEQKRLSWMNDCISWTKLSLQNRRKKKGSVQSHRGLRRAAEASSLPPLCPDFLLQSTGWKSLPQVTTLTLEDLPGCSLSTLAQCTRLLSLSLRCCGLRSLEGLNHLPQLCYIDVQENDISFIDCENMTSLRVLQLSHNKLTSIHGLTGAENLDVLELSHNFITRIAGLESVRRLQRLSVDHNQLISTKGLRDVYTLLHLNCSHNHLASVEGLENSALLNTLDLRANSLTEPPSLNNHILLRELHLDDNSISSLQGLTACWLPLMQHFSVAQNRITQLPSMSDCVSLANLDLRFNCMSELQNVCVSLEGCHFLQEVHLTGNPLQQESGWGSTLQKAVPGLRFIDGQETDSFLSPPAVQQVSLASGNFLMFCQAQLQQTHDLQQQHSRELSDASSPLDAAKTSCRHFTEALQLATDQRFAHEYGDTAVADKHTAAGQTIPEETLDMDRANAEKHAERPEMESTVKVPPIISNRDNIRCSDRTIDEKSAEESRHDTYYTVATGPRTMPTVWKANSGSAHSVDTKRKTVYNHQNLDLQNTAAVVIQHLCKKYREKCGNISSPSTAEKGGGRGGDGGKPESGPSYINGSVVGQDYAATVIQAFWRGFSLRKRLTSALAAVTCPDAGEDDTFEEVDVDEFVFDEEALEKHWTLLLSEDSPPRCYPVSEQLLSVKPPGAFPDPSQYIVPPPLVQNSKQAWVDEELVDSAGHRVSPPSSNSYSLQSDNRVTSCSDRLAVQRSKSPASVISGLSERSEKILEEWGFTHHHTALLMLKRAQNMKSKKQQRKKYRDPSVRLAWFKNQPGPVEARSRQAQHNRNYIKACEAELGHLQAEKTEQVTQERAQQWLHTQAAHSDRDSESEHFLPEINSDVLNGGRVQLVADPGYTERLHHASGLWANSSSAAQPCKQNNYLRKNCLGHTREEVPSPKRVMSAPSKKERISFRDNPVQMSGGWGGGKKRDKVYK